MKRRLRAPAAALLRFLLRWTGRRAGVALVYHPVGDPPGDPERELVPAHGTRLFRDQLHHLRRRYRVVPASDLAEAARTRPRGGRFPVSITFDDDLASHAAIAAPALAESGLPATFFLCGASLDGPHRFWWERLQAAVERTSLAEAARAVLGPDAPAPERIHRLGDVVEAMPPAERDATSERLAALAGPDPADAGLRAAGVRELAERGFEVGFHTRAHHRLTGLDDRQLAAAVSEGRSALEELAGRPLTTIAYPHGKADARVARAAKDAGFRYGFTTAGEPVTPERDPLLLARIEPSFVSVGAMAMQIVRQLARAPS